MDFLFFLKVKDAFIRLHAYLLKLMGKKIVNLDNYREKEFCVKPTYPDTSQKCIIEKSNGATFRWSKTKPSHNYSRYFEIHGEVRVCFKSKSGLLWIKKP